MNKWYYLLKGGIKVLFAVPANKLTIKNLLPKSFSRIFWQTASQTYKSPRNMGEKKFSPFFSHSAVLQRLIPGKQVSSEMASSCFSLLSKKSFIEISKQ
jgi:hypothetical protein